MTFKESLSYRYACKVFDENKKVQDGDFSEILEACRLSPSSFGLEHWDLLLVENEKIKKEMGKACWNQPQITTCSHLVVILAKLEDLKPNSPYIKSMVEKKVGKNSEKYPILLDIINNFLDKNFSNDDKKKYGWSKAQCFLAAQNMMSMAAVLGIDSCPIEGFIEEKLNEILDIDPNKNRVALLLTFGYRDNIQKPKPKIRKNLDEFFKIIK
ncbi:nitroreductase family protein [Campylobacter blaseri]|uniref:NAD(P)H-dependent oxidoreductase n=1 Tax=Campylobacter blaseri TaxID=2042961 RepID=A0A2P8QYJ7_9BACT|nr:NAD(P)H-dependent oxidoreductase [Campylobacter blaseri]PSM51324.1 NAD(P)H-dependent oxidoreductase [Campylobacter blaseri]PSM52468.1 NAD(P)H-dependent oxidoreductase [Campylobacter blaseri]QKF86200.1 nitroreductase family protein [Campylobacter blaseri]